MTEIYFDNNATTRPLKDVRNAIDEALCNCFGNPSSAHYVGALSREKISNARFDVAQLVGVDERRIFFTSGGTESNNWALNSAIKQNPSKTKIITSSIEHSSILAMCTYLESQGYEVEYLSVNKDGLIDLDQLRLAINENTALVSLQLVNNETGVVQDVISAQSICHKAGVLFHTDAAQAVGKLHVDITDFDLVTWTGHKLHAPAGIGALYSKEPLRLRSLLYGGDQEQGLRPGTENIIGIIGFGVASMIRNKTLIESINFLKELRDYFENRLRDAVEDIHINGGEVDRVCNTSNILFPGIDGQALVARLDQLDIRCSQSSACTNQRPEASYVLEAMGLSEDEAYSSVRFSFSIQNTKEEVDFVVEKISNNFIQLKDFAQKFANNGEIE
jgi:cysteine desulfurase